MTEERRSKACTLALCLFLNLCPEDREKVPPWFIRSLLRYYDPELVLLRDPPLTAHEFCLASLFGEHEFCGPAEKLNRYWNGGRDDGEKRFPLLAESDAAWLAFTAAWDKAGLPLVNAGQLVGEKIMHRISEDDALCSVFTVLLYLSGEYTKEEFKRQFPAKCRELAIDLLSYPRD